MYYETNIFNNLLFDRAEQLPSGLGNDTPLATPSLPFIIDPRGDGSVHLFDFSTALHWRTAYQRNSRIAVSERPSAT